MCVHGGRLGDWMGYVNGICFALSLRLIGSREDAKARSFVVLGASRSLFLSQIYHFPNSSLRAKRGNPESAQCYTGLLRYARNDGSFIDV